MERRVERQIGNSVSVIGVPSVDVLLFMTAVRTELMEDAIEASSRTQSIMESADILRIARRVDEVLGGITPRLVRFLIQSGSMGTMGSLSIKTRKIQI